MVWRAQVLAHFIIGEIKNFAVTFFYLTFDASEWYSINRSYFWHVIGGGKEIMQEDIKCITGL
jgi:hypothetical protein